VLVSPPWTGPHRHVWMRHGRLLEVCSDCPAARARSRVAQRLALVVVALGMIAVAGMLARISTTDGRVTLATCSGFGSYYARGSGC
jgi:hypothetical protein